MQGWPGDESHENVLLGYPQYTKPVEYRGERVPDILLSGNHGAIEKWRHMEALKDTKRLRPDLYEKWRQMEALKDMKNVKSGLVEKYALSEEERCSDGTVRTVERPERMERFERPTQPTRPTRPTQMERPTRISKRIEQIAQILGPQWRGTDLNCSKSILKWHLKLNECVWCILLRL